MILCDISDSQGYPAGEIFAISTNSSYQTYMGPCLTENEVSQLFITPSISMLNNFAVQDILFIVGFIVIFVLGWIAGQQR